jgi:hypothetical protein
MGLSGGDPNLFAYVWNKPTRAYDPWGLFGEDVHSGIGNSRYGTYLWATQIGFYGSQAKKISIGNDGTDGGFASWLPMIGLQSRHFDQKPFFSKEDSRITWSEKELQRAVEFYKKGDYDAASGHLGKGLHGIQDLFAHRDWDTGWLGWYAHPGWYDLWDDSRNALIRNEAEKATKDYLKRYRKLTEMERCE